MALSWLFGSKTAEKKATLEECQHTEKAAEVMSPEVEMDLIQKSREQMADLKRISEKIRLIHYRLWTDQEIDGKREQYFRKYCCPYIREVFPLVSYSYTYFMGEKKGRWIYSQTYEANVSIYEYSGDEQIASEVVFIETGKIMLELNEYMSLSSTDQPIDGSLPYKVQEREVKKYFTGPWEDVLDQMYEKARNLPQILKEARLKKQKEAFGVQSIGVSRAVATAPSPKDSSVSSTPNAPFVVPSQPAKKKAAAPSGTTLVRVTCPSCSYKLVVKVPITTDPVEIKCLKCGGCVPVESQVIQEAVASAAAQARNKK